MTPASREALELDKYTAYVYDKTSSKRDPLGVIDYIWQKKPDSFQQNVPREPAALLFNYVTVNANVSIITVYEVPTTTNLNVVYNTVAEALVASLGGQPFRLVKAGGSFYIKEADGLIPITTEDKITA